MKFSYTKHTMDWLKLDFFRKKKSLGVIKTKEKMIWHSSKRDIRNIIAQNNDGTKCDNESMDPVCC